jgi:hypothetical protein
VLTISVNPGRYSTVLGKGSFGNCSIGKYHGIYNMCLKELDEKSTSKSQLLKEARLLTTGIFPIALVSASRKEL